MNRREQLFLLWALSATVLAIGLAGALIFLALPRQPARISLGRVDQFPVGSFLDMNLPLDFSDPLAISHTTPKVWVARDNKGAFTVFYARSTVRGAPVVWVSERDRFEDVEAGSEWDRTGKYIFGPDIRDLDRFPVSVENGELIVERKLIRGASHSE